MKKYLFIAAATLVFAVACEKREMGMQPVKEGPDLDVNVFPYYVSPNPELITLASGVVVEKRGDQYFLDGDIVLSPEHLEALNTSGNLFPEKPDERPETSSHPKYGLPMSLFEQDDTGITPFATGMYPTPYNLWSMVRYIRHSNLTPQLHDRIDASIAHWEDRTNVRFYDATGEPTHDPVYGFEYPRVEFFGNDSVNNSYVGRIGGTQRLNLMWGAPNSTVTHEIGHAIGLRHEHNRPDRNTQIEINWANLKPGVLGNFNLITTDYYVIGVIDYNSVMIYDSYIFNSDAVHDIFEWVMRKKSDNSTWYSGTVLSDLDRRWANSFYLPYVARNDVYRELAPVVYKADNTIMTALERYNLQAELNGGQGCPPENPGCYPL